MDISKLVSQAKVKVYQNQELIFEEGSPSTEGVCFVLSGEVGVYKTMNGESVYLNPVPPASFFGEMALMLGTPRQATARAETNNTKIIFLNKAVFLEEAKTNFAFLRGLVTTTFIRIKNLQEELTHLDSSYELTIPPELELAQIENRELNLTIVDSLKSYRSVFLNKGRTLFAEKAAENHTIFLVLEGELEAIKQVGGKPRPLLTYKPGDFIGVQETLDHGPRFTGVLVLKDLTKVAVFDEELLFRVLRINNTLFFSFFKSILMELLLWQEAYLAVRSNH
ncbi:MAG: cyclic nucleotide-binding domain-containing protein [Spirochaetales bacterium]